MARMASPLPNLAPVSEQQEPSHGDMYANPPDTIKDRISSWARDSLPVSMQPGQGGKLLPDKISDVLPYPLREKKGKH